MNADLRPAQHTEGFADIVAVTNPADDGPAWRGQLRDNDELKFQDLCRQMETSLSRELTAEERTAVRLSCVIETLSDGNVGPLAERPGRKAGK